MDDPTYSLDWAISPIDAKTFLNEYFERKPLVVQRDTPNYYQRLLSIAQIDEIVTSLGLSTPELTVTQAGAGLTSADYADEDGRVDPVRVAQLFADGATIILSGLQDRMADLAQFCRALESVLSCRVQTNIYMTPPASQGFPAHYDSHDVLVLQVEGTKEWRIYDTPLELPLPTQGFSPDTVPIGAETDRFVLGPGDMAYIPRGVTHDAVASETASLHITTGLMVRTWADLLAEAVSMMAHHDADLRRALPPGFGRSEFGASDHQATFEQMLGRVAQDTPLEKLFETFRDAFVADRLPRVPNQLAEVARLSTLSLDSAVGPRPHLIYDLTTDAEDGKVRLLCQGAEIEFPDHVRVPLAFALSTERFRVKDLPGDLDDAGKLVLVRRLVREGLLVFRD